MTRREYIAWAAGIYEGEGCISALRYASGRVGVRMCVSNADLEVLHRFSDVVGFGSIRPVSRHDKPAHHKDVYEWAVQKRADVHVAINMLWPWLTERRRDQIAAVMSEVTPLLPTTHCRRGHDYSRHGRRYGGKWHCTRCQRDRQRERRQRASA